MRKFHRWITAVAMILLAYVALTGLLLALDAVTSPQLPPRGGDGQGGSQAAAVAPVQGAPIDRSRAPDLLAEAAGAALAARTGGEFSGMDVQLHLDGDAPRSSVSFTEAGEAGGAMSTYTQLRVNLHWLLKELHSGSIVGLPGRLLDVLTGLCFVILAFTGIVMYFQMLAKRRASGRTGWLWK